MECSGGGTGETPAPVRRRRGLVVMLACLLATAGCGRKKKALAIPMVRIGATETGVASWYGHPYHGRASASGEIYDMERMTAAHRTLPFHTRVRVLNLENRKAVEVRINDRGPFWDGRIIDLSRAAARSLDMIGPGTARVQLEIIGPPGAAAPARYAVQVGAFREQANAERLRRRMEGQFGAARLVRRDPFWLVLVGEEPDESAARALADRIREAGSASALIVRLDL